MPNSILTLDEAIEHCWLVAVGKSEQEACAECKADHMRLLGWLQELKRYKEKYGEL